MQLLERGFSIPAAAEYDAHVPAPWSLPNTGVWRSGHLNVPLTAGTEFPVDGT